KSRWLSRARLQLPLPVCLFLPQPQFMDAGNVLRRPNCDTGTGLSKYSSQARLGSGEGLSISGDPAQLPNTLHAVVQPNHTIRVGPGQFTGSRVCRIARAPHRDFYGHKPRVAALATWNKSSVICSISRFCPWLAICNN